MEFSQGEFSWAVNETFEVPVPVEPEPPGRSNWPTTALALGCCFSASIVLVNLVLGASIIAGKNFNTFTVCVFHMMVLDLTVGAVVLPFTTLTEYKMAWDLGEIACRFWVTLDLFLSVLVIVTCAVINLERILEVGWLRYRIWRELWSWKHFLFIWIPWGCVLAVGVPLYVMGTGTNYIALGTCYVEWKRTFFFAFTVTEHFLPIFMAVVTILVAVVASLCLNSRRVEDGYRPGILSSTVAIVLVTTSVVLMVLPFSVLSFIVTIWPNWGNNLINANVFMALYWTSLCNSLVRPLCWFFDPEIRLGYKALYTKCCCKGHANIALYEADLNKVKCEEE